MPHNEIKLKEVILNAVIAIGVVSVCQHTLDWLSTNKWFFFTSGLTSGLREPQFNLGADLYIIPALAILASAIINVALGLLRKERIKGLKLFLTAMFLFFVWASFVYPAHLRYVGWKINSEDLKFWWGVRLLPLSLGLIVGGGLTGFLTLLDLFQKVGRNPLSPTFKRNTLILSAAALLGWLSYGLFNAAYTSLSELLFRTIGGVTVVSISLLLLSFIRRVIINSTPQ